jgi:hypothetical protein
MISMFISWLHRCATSLPHETQGCAEIEADLVAYHREPTGWMTRKQYRDERERHDKRR